MNRHNGPVKTGLKHLDVGARFLGFCVVRKIQLKFKNSGEPYLVLELGDRSGRLSARLWEDARQWNEALHPGTILKVKGKIQSFHGFKELKILKMRPVNDTDSVEIAQLVPASDRDVEELKQQFQSYLDGVRNPYLQTLLQAIFSSREVLNTYLQLPAGKLWHHNYLYGMLEHLVFLLDLAATVLRHYPRADRDLLFAGIICHELGKLKAFRLKGYIDYSDVGRLISAGVLGYEMVKKEADQIGDFPPELKKNLLHILLSGAIQEEKAPLVAPMTLEAIILNKLKELDVQVNAFNRVLEKDVMPGEKWSKYVPLLERFVYSSGPAGGEPEAPRGNSETHDSEKAESRD